MARLLKTVTLAGIAYGLFLYVKQLLEEPEPGTATTPQWTTPPPAAPPKAPAPKTGSATTRSPRASAPPSTPSADLSKAELYERAKQLGIEGRSKMSKSELRRAIDDAS